MASRQSTAATGGGVPVSLWLQVLGWVHVLVGGHGQVAVGAEGLPTGPPGGHAAPVGATQHAHADQVEDLTHVEHDADGRRTDHEVCEDPLFGWPGDITVDLVLARPHITGDLAGHVEVGIDVMQQIKEKHLHAGFEEQAKKVSPPQAPVLLSWVIV